MPNLRGKTWTTSTPANVEDAQFWEDHLISSEDATKLENITGVPDGGSSGQVLTKTANGIEWNDPASSGHTVQNADGVDMPYQGTLQFLGADVANDPANGKTVVDCHGEKGDAATIAAGTVTILPPGSTPTVTNSGTSSDAVFDFEIPSSGGVSSFNGRSGSVLPMAGDYDSRKILLASVLHIGGETQDNAQEALEALEGNIEQIYADNGVLGAKNFLNPTYAGGTVNGVTITANENKTYELNGAPSSGNMAVAIYTGTFPVGRYILNGVPDFTTYGARLHIRETAGASQVDAIDTGKGIEFTIPSATTSYSVFMYLNSGYTANNLIIKPMIRLASDPDDTYQPHAMTNRELTERVDNLDMFKKDIRINQTTGETLSSMLDRMLAALISYIQSLNTNYYVFLESLSIPGYDTISPERLYIINPSSTWTASEIMFSRVRATASDIKINSVAMYASSSNYYRGILKYDGSAGSVNNIGSNTDVTNITLRMMVFKQYG